MFICLKGLQLIYFICIEFRVQFFGFIDVKFNFFQGGSQKIVIYVFLNVDL